MIQGPDDLAGLWDGIYVENNIYEMWSVVQEVQTVSPLHTILEVGVALGGTLRLWERLLQERGSRGLLIGIDAAVDTEGRLTGRITCPCGPGWKTPVRTPLGGNWKVLERRGNILRLESDQLVYCVIGDSTDPMITAQVFSLLEQREIDLYFHDGAHYGRTPVLDFVNYGKALRVGGLLCAADVGNCDPKVGPLVLDSGIQQLYRFLPEPKRKASPDVYGMGLWKRPVLGPFPDVSSLLALPELQGVV